MQFEGCSTGSPSGGENEGISAPMNCTWSAAHPPSNTVAQGRFITAKLRFACQQRRGEVGRAMADGTGDANARDEDGG